MKQAAVFIFLMLMLSAGIAVGQSNELQLAQQYTANGEPDKAYEIYQKLYKQDNETYFTVFITNLIAIKKLDEAESIAKKMSRRYPEVPEYTLKLATIYTQQGKADEANELYEGLIKKMPADVAAISMLGMQFYQNGNIDQAIQTFKQGRKVLNNDGPFVNELLTLYRYKRDKTALTEEYLNLLPQNKGYIDQAESVLANLYDEADYDMLKFALLKRIQKAPDENAYVEMLIWQYLQRKEYDQALTQAIALNRRGKSEDSNLYDLCRTLADEEAYDAAIKGFEYLISKGKEGSVYVSAKIELINTKSEKVTSGKYLPADLLSLESDYTNLITEFGKGRSTVYALQRLARLDAFKLHKLAEAQRLLEEAVKIPGLSAQAMASCKLDLGDVYLLNGQPWEATLLYSQVEKDFPDSEMEQDAKLRNAKLAYYTGDFVYAKGMLDVLKAATSKLIANDALNLQLLIQDNTVADTAGEALKMYARADLQIFAEQPERALKILDSVDRKFPGNTLADDILMARAKLFIAGKEYEQAAVALKSIAEDHNQDLWADDAVFMLGDIYENDLNDKELAKSYYQKIITDYPGSLWVNEARKRFRILRGDTTGV
ncbi:tetratricopeptide repeat protein [Mucilaginibacter limnophilus]|uniref:Tetratricopeptide repeat protein n=1 Tax=Mucilaginibacter limnophilus TaxID=1932778 RepID=A0A437MV77_9SPHI|nr:tetratricopeptide repeat protein [Mucilaginibacter limnophilus]RVU01569.1 tetratricopeptide repeat protein [Mucilaginibacter limnophilus]